MRPCRIPTIDGKTELRPAYDINDFPLSRLDKKVLLCRKKKPKSYHYTFGTFDIESTTIQCDTPYGFMYHWQMCIGGLLLYGRTWTEFITFIHALVDYLNISMEERFVIYVHNLAFEFEFLYRFLERDFGGFSVFASKKRKPIYVTCGNGIEFRCSYKLTNMSLEKACENEKGMKYRKASGDLDYRKLRTADTHLSYTEFGYCMTDVASLYDLIQNRLQNEKDNLETIPMTSTGYVRRDVRRSCRKDEHYRDDVFLYCQMTQEIYTLLKEEGRGGDTHANRYMSGRIWHDVDSYDAVSSYPAQLLLRKYPMTKFVPYGDIESMEEFNTMISHYACLFRIGFTNLRVKKETTMPYISVSKCLQCVTPLLDNGRVLSSPLAVMALNDIDYKIIARDYEWDNLAITDLYFAEYGYLPNCITDVIMDYFAQKCELKEQMKNLEDGEEKDNLTYLYNKIKNKLNGIFGMMYTDPIHSDIALDTDSGEWSEMIGDIAKKLDKYNNSRNSFLVYAWGSWCTAWGRFHLHELYNMTGSGTIYGDTDSSKAVNVDQTAIDRLNESIIAMCKERNAYYQSNSGKTYYLGVFEKETKEPMTEFVTLGAKKYVYTDRKGLHCTISGVSKKLGAKELGNIYNFRPGFIFREAAGLTLYYNDDPIHTITIDGCTMETASSIGMVDSTYEIGITGEYAELIDYNVYRDLI